MQRVYILLLHCLPVPSPLIIVPKLLLCLKKNFPPLLRWPPQPQYTPRMGNYDCLLHNRRPAWFIRFRSRMKSVYDTAHVFGRVIKNSVWRVRRYFNVTLALLSDQSGSHISPTSHLFRILSASNAPGWFFFGYFSAREKCFSYSDFAHQIFAFQ